MSLVEEEEEDEAEEPEEEGLVWLSVCDGVGEACLVEIGLPSLTPSEVVCQPPARNAFRNLMQSARCEAWVPSKAHHALVLVACGVWRVACGVCCVERGARCSGVAVCGAAVRRCGGAAVRRWAVRQAHGVAGGAQRLKESHSGLTSNSNGAECSRTASAPE